MWKPLVATSALSLLAAGSSGFMTARPAVTTEQAIAGADAYAVDAVHSALIFRIDHAGVSPFYGRINNPAGSFKLEPGAADNEINLTVSVVNIDTNSEGRDQHLKNPDFFNAREYPEITFTSAAIEQVDDRTFRATGDFTMHGVTKEITVEIENVRAAESRMGKRAGFGAEFTIKRSDFGMDLYVDSGMLGDEVTIMAGIEGIIRE